MINYVRINIKPDFHFLISARRSVYLETQHPDGLEKIRELEAQGHPTRLEIEEPIPTPPRFVTELRVCFTIYPQMTLL